MRREFRRPRNRLIYSPACRLIIFEGQRRSATSNGVPFKNAAKKPPATGSFDFAAIFRYEAIMKSIPSAFWFFVGLLLCCVESASAADAPATFKVGQFTFKRPEKWEWVKPTSEMRAAELKVPDAKGKADVIFFIFGGGQGGGTKANIDRWLAKFQEPRDKINAKTEEASFGPRKVTYVQAQGTYDGAMPGGPKMLLKEHALLGAIIEGGEGNVFVRMTGPIDVVKGAEGEFKKMIESGVK